MRTALVTGGSRGIGRAIALELASTGHRIVLSYRQDVARADATVAYIRALGGEAVAIASDVTKAADVRALGDRVTSEFGGADVLVNNAGVIKDAIFPLMKEEDWDLVLDTDLKGAFRVTKAVVTGCSTRAGDASSTSCRSRASPATWARRTTRRRRAD
jgi:3-oxoacyl-[acyl-carrier protein] reductase